MRCSLKRLYEDNRWQEKDSLRSKKSENFAIQRKSADDPFNFKKLENFWHSAEIEGYGGGGDVI